MFSKTVDEFVKSEMRVWGTEYVEDLIEQGYTPVQVTDNATGTVKWSWVLSTRNYVRN